MNLLILGGTAFLGRAVAAAALAQGHQVTCAARGSAPVAPGATLVRLDRDTDGLAAVSDHRWDAVVDVSRQPGQVRAAVRELDTAHRVFVSTGNVYADHATPGTSEDAPLLPASTGDVLPPDADGLAYGSAKVACEEAVREGRSTATVVRAGLIGGPGDVTGRVGYYPWRFAHPTGDDVLVPPDPTFPVAVIDVDDLAGWIVTAAQQRLDGTYDATGPTTDLATVLDAARRVAGSSAVARPVPAEVLADAGVEPFMGTPSLPLWIPDPDWRGFMTKTSRRARRDGLVTRPLEHTLERTLAWEEGRDAPRACGLTDAQERQLREVLDARGVR